MQHNDPIGPFPAPQARSVVVYDPDDGEILHVHHLLLFEGADRACLEGLEEQALAHARTARDDLHEDRKIATLDLGERLLDPERRYRIDLDHRQLVELRDRAKRDAKDGEGSGGAGVPGLG
jgi:hypothetical protein